MGAFTIIKKCPRCNTNFLWDEGLTKTNCKKCRLLIFKQGETFPAKIDFAVVIEKTYEVIFIGNRFK